MKIRKVTDKRQSDRQEPQDRPEDEQLLSFYRKESGVSTSGIVTITTDFGTIDEYVGVMKGVILNRFSGAILVDITHDIAPGDIKRTAYLLDRTLPYFSPGTVHLVVVDPGVGSTRRAVAALAGDHFLVAPDNGVLSVVLDRYSDWLMVAIEEPGLQLHPVSATFHGRDIFAPVAAHLAGGDNFWDLGPRLTDPVVFPIPQPRKDAGPCIIGEILYIDRFGNLVTNIPRPLILSALGTDEGDGFTIGAGSGVLDTISPCYSAVPPGSLLALFGSGGTLEISVCGASAADDLDVKPGATVVIKRTVDIVRT